MSCHFYVSLSFHCFAFRLIFALFRRFGDLLPCYALRAAAMLLLFQLHKQALMLFFDTPPYFRFSLMPPHCFLFGIVNIATPFHITPLFATILRCFHCAIFSRFATFTLFIATLIRRFDIFFCADFRPCLHLFFSAATLRFDYARLRRLPLFLSHTPYWLLFGFISHYANRWHHLITTMMPLTDIAMPVYAEASFHYAITITPFQPLMAWYWCHIGLVIYEKARYAFTPLRWHYIDIYFHIYYYCHYIDD